MGSKIIRESRVFFQSRKCLKGLHRNTLTNMILEFFSGDNLYNNKPFQNL